MTPRRPIEDIYPLSPMQMGMLFQALSELEKGACQLQQVLAFDGPLQPEALRLAWEDCVGRHAILRTRFSWKDLKQPLQIVHPPGAVALAWEEKDLSHLSEAERTRQWERLLSQDLEHPLALNQPPLMRCILVRMAPLRHQCVWTVSQLLLDGWSSTLLLRDLFDRYMYRIGGQQPTPRAVSLFRDYVAASLKTATPEADAHWRELLAGREAPTRLADQTARPGSKDRAGDYADVRRTVSGVSVADLIAAARSKHVTLNTLVQAAWGLVLSRFTGETDLLFGTTSAGRPVELAGAAEVVGPCLCSLPLRLQVRPSQPLQPWLAEIQAQQARSRHFELTPLPRIQALSNIPAGQPLFESLLVFQNYPQAPVTVSGLRVSKLSTVERNALPFTLFVTPDDQLQLHVHCALSFFSVDRVERWLRHFEHVLLEMASAPNDAPVERLFALPPAERENIRALNDTALSTRLDDVVTRLQAAVEATPHAPALVYRKESLTYRELWTRAASIAQALRMRGAGPERVIGILLDRTPDMVASIWAVLMTGAAYLPLDPLYPSDRLRFMVQDSGAHVILTSQRWLHHLDDERQALRVESVLAAPPSPPEPVLNSSLLAYLLYTSGSTGRPKGVMVSRHNLAQFLDAMDRALPAGPQSTWLALTSISFDISVLELLWTLCRGFKVVLHPSLQTSTDTRLRRPKAHKPPGFSLFFFASEDATRPHGNPYRLLMDSARFADNHGFEAVWTPERHFHPFGGLYPNPSVTSAAVAAVTSNIRIRAGSVVLPLHSVLRVAEEWAVVDHLSEGRVGVSIASGWHPNDFVLAPEAYADRKKQTLRAIGQLRALWKGDSLSLPTPTGERLSVAIHPRPRQAELPLWLTASGSDDTFRLAGELGMNLLTHLLGQDLKTLARRIEIYRNARQSAGHAGPGHVTLMLHTFLGADLAQVRQTVREPFLRYLRSSSSLMHAALGETPALDEAGAQTQLERAFDRFFNEAGFFGPPPRCALQAERLADLGVDELACLIDFGVADDLVLQSLPLLAELQRLTHMPSSEDTGTVGEEILRHHVTHLQVTPSHLRGILQEGSALKNLEVLAVGGEALPLDIAQQAVKTIRGNIYNLYGPTETTIWSSVGKLAPQPASVSLGGPLPNTRMYVLDTSGCEVPLGARGMLHIGGSGVSRGYLHRPEMTAEAFVPDPWGAPGDRMYRTGDWVKRLPEGGFEFLGRTDHQVKIRGFRIELAEIEAALLKHPAVHAAVVVVVKAPEARLVAYVARREGITASDEALLGALTSTLPPHMLPSQVVTVPSLPLTANGKVDRQAVARIPLSAVSANSSTPPSTPTEQKLAEIWKEVLRREDVGTQTGFFQLGGDSILALQIVAMAKRAGLDLSVPILLQKQTIEQIGAALDLRLPTTMKGPPFPSQLELPAAHRVEVEVPSNCSALQAREALRELGPLLPCIQQDGDEVTYRARTVDTPPLEFWTGPSSEQDAALLSLERGLSPYEGKPLAVLFVTSPATAPRLILCGHPHALDVPSLLAIAPVLLGGPHASGLSSWRALAPALASERAIPSTAPPRLSSSQTPVRLTQTSTAGCAPSFRQRMETERLSLATIVVAALLRASQTLDAGRPTTVALWTNVREQIPVPTEGMLLGPLSWSTRLALPARPTLEPTSELLRRIKDALRKATFASAPSTAADFHIATFEAPSDTSSLSVLETKVGGSFTDAPAYLQVIRTRDALRFSWGWDDAHADRIAGLAKVFVQTFEAFVSDSGTAPHPTLVSSDFPETGLDEDSLENLLHKLNKG